MSRAAALAYVVLAGCAFESESRDATATDTAFPDAAVTDSGAKDAAPADADPMDAAPADDAEPADADPRDADPTDADPTDADPPDTGPPVRIEVGTGSIQFDPLTAGQTVELSTGPQGGDRYQGFHIWFGLRSWGLNPDGINLTFTILLASDRTEQARLNWLTNLQPSATGADEIWGGNPRLLDCCVVLSQDLIMRVEAIDADGLSAAGEIEVRAESECADLMMNYCP